MSTSPVMRGAKPGLVRCEFCVFLQDMMTLERLGSLDESMYLTHLSKTHGLEK
ncbi:MAG: hypothetical protein ACRECH_16980 [Nitrososphaerales archaeon]